MTKRYTGGEIIADYLIANKVEYIAGIPGHGCLPIFDAIRDRVRKGQIKYIQVKQEMSGVHMADGYYRASGKPMAVLTSIGPGALNTAIGVATSFVDSTPLLIISGDAHVHMRGVGILQEIERHHDSDFLSCMRPITKRCWRVENIAQLPKIMQRAFEQMMTGRKGPVLLSVPMDVQADSIETAIGKYINEKDYEYDLIGSEQLVDNAIKIMMTASRPVILAGGGVYYSRAYDELVKLAEMWGAAVITTMASKSVFPEDHPLYGWHGGSKGTEVGNYLCRTADVVLSLGCRFADETTSSYRKGITYNFPETKLIQVDIDPREIGKNYPCDLGILGDVKSVMNQLIKRFEEQGKKPAYRETEYYRDIQRAKSEWFEKLKTSREKEMVPVTISQFLEELSKVYPKNGVIVTSSGNAQAQVFQEYCFSVPGTHITTGGFSTMGFGFNAAMGAKLAMPDTPVMAIIGDGDFMMAMQELSTAAQYDIPVIVVVMNNCGWLAIKDLQADVYGEQYTFGSDFTTKDGSIYSPDFKAVADAFGVYSQIISRKEEVVPAVQKALASGRPSLIEVLVNRTYPYSGGKATGWWDVPVPAYIKDKYEEYIRAKNEEYLR